MNNTMLGIVYSNMYDTSLGDLTLHRTMGSVPVGGRYRLVDFALSNMVNSGITDVGIITKSNYHSLMDHVGSGREWDLSRKIGGLTILPPFSRSGTGMYEDNIEALSGIMGFIKASSAKYVVLSYCDVIANIDFKEVLENHQKSGKGITVLYSRGELEENSKDNTVLVIGQNNLLKDILLNPDIQGDQNLYLNMAIIERDLLIRLISEAVTRNKHSFQKDILQAQADRDGVNCYHFKGTCARIHCMESYFKANMLLLDKEVRTQIFDPRRPVYTKVRDEVPARYGLRSQVSNSLVADGCIIEGRVENSIIFRGVRIGQGAVIKNSIIMQGCVIEDNAQLSYVVADKDVLIRDGRSLGGYLTYPLYLPKAIHV
ncbi:MAG: glucose-1-phosphate adenylyltransferase subunit GlgD [Angelakisella sp.]|nr:glucose-1-phosphate adenylyltransferase subunit GlgD [Angelakisella sp.]